MQQLKGLLLQQMLRGISATMQELEQLHEHASII